MVDDITASAGTAEINNDASESETALQWLQPLRRGLLSQYAVGTVDQAMLSVMQVRYGALRLLGLSGKALILDEIHAYDTYMETIIERLLEWCRAMRIPVVLLSATLPMRKKRDLLHAYGASAEQTLSDAYPLITTVDEDGAVGETAVSRVHMHREYAIKLHPHMNDADKTAKLALQCAKTGGCVCVLVNTVKRAQAVYLRLRESGCDADLRLFHARFPAENRQRIEELCVSLYGKEQGRRPKAGILVATQVAEQSFDVDFDVLITDLAPIDLILQRMGRVHRFDHTPRPADKRTPRIHVLTNPNGYEKDYIYAGILMQRTQTLLETMSTIATPEQIRFCVEQVYHQQPETDKAAYDLWAKQAFAVERDSAKAKGQLLSEPSDACSSLAQAPMELWLEDEPSINRSASTRLSDESTRVILLTEEERRALPDKPDRESAKRLLRRSVSLHSDMFGDKPPDAEGQGLLKGVLLLTTRDGVAHWGGYAIWNDPELGTRIEKEG